MLEIDKKPECKFTVSLVKRNSFGDQIGTVEFSCNDALELSQWYDKTARYLSGKSSRSNKNKNKKKKENK